MMIQNPFTLRNRLKIDQYLLLKLNNGIIIKEKIMNNDLKLLNKNLKLFHVMKIQRNSTLGNKYS